MDAASARLAVGDGCPLSRMTGRQPLGRACAAVTRDPMAMELLATTGDAFVRVGAHTRLQDSGAQCLALDGDTVYVGCRGRGLKRSADGGDTFEDVPLPERDVFSVAVGAAACAEYVGTEPSRLFRSRDGGESWEELVALQEIPSRPDWSFPPRPWTSHVRWIAPSPHDPELVLVGIELGGLMRTEDGGASFSDHRPEAARDVHCLAWHPSARGRAYEAGGESAATRGRWPSTRPIPTAGSSRRPPARSRHTGAARPTRRSTAGRAPAPGRRSRARSTPTSTRLRPDEASSSPVWATARCSTARTAARAGPSCTNRSAGSPPWP